MVLPKTLYVGELKEGDAVVYAADPEPSAAREDGGPVVQVLGVYQLVGTVETRSVLEITPVKAWK